MTQETLARLQNEQTRMDRQATWTVIALAFIVHLILNIYAFVMNDAILKIEAPVMSVITAIAVIISLKFISHAK